MDQVVTGRCIHVRIQLFGVDRPLLRTVADWSLIHCLWRQKAGQGEVDTRWTRPPCLPPCPRWRVRITFYLFYRTWARGGGGGEWIISARSSNSYRWCVITQVTVSFNAHNSIRLLPSPPSTIPLCCVLLCRSPQQTAQAHHYSTFYPISTWCQTSFYHSHSTAVTWPYSRSESISFTGRGW